MTAPRIIRALALPAAALTVITLAGCGASSHHAAAPRMSPACATAVQVSRYVSGKTVPTNGADDLAEASMLSLAHWQTPAERETAAAASRVLGRQWGSAPSSGLATMLPPVLLTDMAMLLGTCAAAGK